MYAHEDIQGRHTYLTVGWPICKWDADSERACRSRTAFFRERKQVLTSLRNISCLTRIFFSPFCATSGYILAFIHTAGYAYLPGSVTHAYKDIPCNPDHQVTGKPQCKRFSRLSNEAAELDNVCAHDIAFWQLFERRPSPKSSGEPPDGIEHHGQSQRKLGCITIGDQNRYRVERVALRKRTC